MRTSDTELGAHWDEQRRGVKIRHDKTQVAVKAEITRMIRSVSRPSGKLLEIGALEGHDTVIYRRALGEDAEATIYDWRDLREGNGKSGTNFACVDLEKDTFPHPDGHFDVVVINQVLEHLKNIFKPLSEIARVVRPGGHVIVSVPNLSAMHNCALLALGRQPTTTWLGGSHVRGYGIWSMDEFLQQGGYFATRSLKGFGLHPFTSASLPALAKTYCHTPVWLLERQASTNPNWEQVRNDTFTSTNF